MNFLAHAFLSPDDEEMLVGNVCADLIKGAIPASVSPGIRAGIALHRAIDRYVDHHPAFIGCKAYIAPSRRRYAAVIIDVFFDHCLAVNWDRYSATAHDTFVDAACASIDRYATTLPVRDPERLRRMLDSRWLSMYATRPGIARAFSGLANRARFTDTLRDAPSDLANHYSSIEDAFHTLMPALIEHLRALPGQSNRTRVDQPASTTTTERGSPTA